MVTAIVSVMTGIPVRRDVAMTGEITLRGRVLPIGGLKEKLLAAARGGMKTVLIPEENAKDLVEISDTIKKGLEIIPVTRMDEVLERALVRKPDPIEWDEASAKLAARAAASEPAVEEDGSGLTAH
jgi:ATP-dependent Lon protease